MAVGRQDSPPPQAGQPDSPRVSRRGPEPASEAVLFITLSQGHHPSAHSLHHRQTAKSSPGSGEGSRGVPGVLRAHPPHRRFQMLGVGRLALGLAETPPPPVSSSSPLLCPPPLLPLPPPLPFLPPPPPLSSSLSSLFLPPPLLHHLAPLPITPAPSRLRDLGLRQPRLPGPGSLSPSKAPSTPPQLLS